MENGVRVATVQPPFPEGEEGHHRMVERGVKLAEDAAKAGAHIICLPELFGVFGLPEEAWPVGSERDDVLAKLTSLAQSHRVTVLYPTVEHAESQRFNTTWVIASDGSLSGCYRKVHLTRSERENTRLTPGNHFPVFEAQGLVFGIMVCYDVYFPESARILALKGGRVIFFPSLQRNATEALLSLQVRSRVVDNSVYVVRSSYGHPADVPWNPGMMVGMSCIVDWEGRIIADLGHDEGFVTAEVPQAQRPQRTSFDGPEDLPRKYLFEDRRPETYRTLCDPTSSGAETPKGT